MNFTREPIIETIITPREGCKIVVRSSKGNGQEDYFVDAVEVVSFGHSFFFRSQERPKSFLVPVGDYEILEIKETRMVLKNASPERAIKIGGGREQPRMREAQPHDESLSSSGEPRSDRKREKRRRGGRRGRGEPLPESSSSEASSVPALDEDTLSPEAMPVERLAPASSEEPQKPVSFISKLFPPPSTLIKDTIGRYKPIETDLPPSLGEASPEGPELPVEDEPEEE